ncbi:hypothetical protein SISSUDRAFT_983498, partial [Sistotremastrum suecicum HHB10207 ss-3]
AWGGAKEQAAEKEQGIKGAKNWLVEAVTIIKRTVRGRIGPLNSNIAPNPTVPAVANDDLDYDELRRKQLLDAEEDEGWEIEYARYNKDLAREVQRDTDLVEWWWQSNSRRCPVLARMALDVLPVQASSVACERLFSSAKLTTTDLRSRLGTDELEKLQLLKFEWKRDVVDLVKENEHAIEDCDVKVDEEFYRGLEALDAIDEEWEEDEDHIAI